MGNEDPAREVGKLKLPPRQDAPIWSIPVARKPWECPRCSRIWGPEVQACAHCNSKISDAEPDSPQSTDSTTGEDYRTKVDYTPPPILEKPLRGTIHADAEPQSPQPNREEE